jgi:8-oxo-dGTP diphosphatase
MKSRYVAGFLFDKKGEQVALIEKQRPDWQRFKLNGIGGKIEKNQRNCMCYENDCDQTNFDPCICPWETPDEAMRREFREETGVDLTPWRLYCVLHNARFEVNFFCAFDDAVFDVRTNTDEQVRVYDLVNVLDFRMTHPLIDNLRWLIPMAFSTVYEPNVMKFDIQQVDYYV